MAGNMTIATAIKRITHLTPTYRSPVLRGDGIWVLTPATEVPEELRDAQRRRTEHYTTVHDATSRTKPDDAPRYVVTSYGQLIAWVSLDGQTHFPPIAKTAGMTYPRWNAMRRHQAAVRAVWPDRMGMGADGEPSPRIPAGMRVSDDDGALIPLLTTGERVRMTDGRRGTIHTPEAGGFVRVMLDGDRDDSLIDVTRLRRSVD